MSLKIFLEKIIINSFSWVPQINEWIKKVVMQQILQKVLKCKKASLSIGLFTY